MSGQVQSSIDAAMECPVPAQRPKVVQLAHGGGGRMMKQLIEEVFLEGLHTPLEGRHDAAVLPVEGVRLAMTTDTYVVTPRFFPGGDIGRLAVYGTVNDLAMAGARPAYLTAGFVLEEGLSLEELKRVVASMREAAEACGVELVAGDTKVVERGKADGLFVNTTGVGWVPEGVHVHPWRVQPGDAVLVSGDVGRHGIAVLSVREGLAFETPVESDCAPLCGLVERMQSLGVELHCLRDATRGGLATVLNEVAQEAGVGVEVEEQAVPVSEAVAGACELLGLDALYVACEGRMVAFVPEAQVEQALDALHGHPLGAGAARMGRVTEGPAGQVSLKTRPGGLRLLDWLSGEQLPRIC